MKRRICILDTEFNALDYAEQNDGLQEVVEIGAVILENGKIVDRFEVICQLYTGHQLTKRCQKFTSITPEDVEDGVPFRKAFRQLQSFLRRNQTNRIYAYGPEDAIRLRETAKLCQLHPDAFDLINSIRNIYPMFHTGLGLRYQCSLTDVCKICCVSHDLPGREHQALYDAEDTALAYTHMLENKINSEFLAELMQHKDNVGIYERHRTVRSADIATPPFVDDDFVTKLKMVLEHAQSVVGRPVIRALHDDMMRVIGKPELEKGSKDL